MTAVSATVLRMDDDLAVARRARMRWNTPLSPGHAGLLLDRLDAAGARRIADPGCGWGELLMCAVERSGAAAGVGVDNDPVALDRGRAEARRRGLADRVTFVQADAATWTGTADRALCVGAAHALGGTLAALATVVPRGGRLLYGDGCWPGPPTPLPSSATRSSRCPSWSTPPAKPAGGSST